MRIAVGVALSFAIGFLCRAFKLPAPAPPEFFGVLLVVAMTLGYIAAGTVLHRKPGVPPPQVAANKKPAP
ncbi:MAG: DUF1427 family protein [Elusimicrobiota bacterium]